MEFVLRSGDLDNRRTSQADRDAMQAGSRIHKRHLKIAGGMDIEVSKRLMARIIYRARRTVELLADFSSRQAVRNAHSDIRVQRGKSTPHEHTFKPTQGNFAGQDIHAAIPRGILEVVCARAKSRSGFDRRARRVPMGCFRSQGHGGIPA